MNIQDIDIRALLKVVAKGESGSGKTIFAGSFPDVYFVALEQRMKPLKTFYKTRKDINFDFFPTWTRAKMKIESLSTSCPYKTVVIDNVTSMSDKIIQHLMQFQGTVTRDVQGKEKGKLIKGIHVPGIEDWLAEDVELRWVIEKIMMIQAHVILVAHVIDVPVSQLGGKTTVSRTLITGAKKVAAKIPGYFDEVYHFNSETEIDGTISYNFLTRCAGIDYAKTAFDTLPDKINFTNKNAYEILMSFIGEEVSTAQDVKKDGGAGEDLTTTPIQQL